MNPVTPRDFKTMRFLCSAPAAHVFPAPEMPEIAFAGRSNAGKSSALNTLCERKNLARTSKTPGRTQAINFFTSDNLRFADLPGYGFARVPPQVRQAWQSLVEGYLANRDHLAGVVLVMDARRPLTEFDQQLLAWGKAFDLAFHCLLTKADKLSNNQRINTLRQVQQTWPDAEFQLFSATRRQGVDEARDAIAALVASKHEQGRAALNTGAVRKT